ncbi:mannitol dehydrogenase family protein [soil metagenome]
MTPAPARVVHLGRGAFARAHQATYTQHTPDSGAWPLSTFGGRGGAVADALAAQGGRYTLVTRGPDADSFETISSITSTHPAADHDAWLDRLAAPEVAVVTATVTEAGWCLGPSGGLEHDLAAVQADIDALRRDPTAPVTTPPGRLVAGLAARRRADAGPLAIVPCDNLAGNGSVAATVVGELTEAVDSTLAAWVAASVSFVSTVVDRITPRTTDADIAAVAQATGFGDRAPVVTEPFSEWVLTGAFPAGRPGWEAAGAVIVDDVAPFEARKLWLLNGAHSLLAYLGSIRGHATVDSAMADDVCREAVARWWAGARGPLTPPATEAPAAQRPAIALAATDEMPAAELDAYTRALAERFANPRMAHRLDQIAADGSRKLPARILPLLLAERRSGAEPTAATVVLAAWLANLRGTGAAVVDVDAERFVALAGGPLTTAARRVLDALHAGLGDDDVTVSLVAAQAERIERTQSP